MATATELHPPSPDLLVAASALDAEGFERLVDGLLRVRAGRIARRVDSGETSLLARINAGPAPDEWSRYFELRQRQERGSIASDERAELLRLTDAIELYQADRVAALTELAVLRGVSIERLMAELGIDRPAAG